MTGNFATEMNKSVYRMAHKTPIKSAFDASARIFSSSVTTRLPRRFFSRARIRIDSQTSKFGSSVLTGAQHGAGLTAIENFHVITRWGKGWSYDGETVGGRFNGPGILTTDSSDRFDGHWNDGKMNGFGVLLRANGERYFGDWKDDKPNGRGALRHADGSEVD